MNRDKPQRRRFVGIDVSKKELHLACSEGKPWVLANTARDHQKLVRQLAGVELVVLEATGGLERELVHAFHKAELPVAVINPRHARDFAKACGRLAKKDRVDATMLAEFGQRMQPRITPPKPDHIQALDELLTRKDQLIRMRASEKTRLCQGRCTESIVEHIDWLNQQVKQLQSELNKLLSAHGSTKEQVQRLEAVCCVGRGLAQTLIVDLRELGRVNPKQIAALVGVAPFNCDSGNQRGQRHVWGGRARVRRALYMSALVGTRFNPELKSFYQRLLSRGKPKKVALIACARKLLVWLNAMQRDQANWSPALIAADA